MAFLPPADERRLKLRPFRPLADVEPMYAYRRLDDVCRYAPIEPATREQIAGRLTDSEHTRPSLDAEGQHLSLAVELLATGEMIGDVVLFWHSATHRQGEIGYLINPDHQGKGYGTEAARAIIDVGFNDVGLHRIAARIDERNTASLAIARKLGMRQEARHAECEYLKGEWVTLTDWAVLEQEWRQP